MQIILRYYFLHHRWADMYLLALLLNQSFISVLASLLILNNFSVLQSEEWGEKVQVRGEFLGDDQRPDEIFELPLAGKHVQRFSRQRWLVERGWVPTLHLDRLLPGTPRKREQQPQVGWRLVSLVTEQFKGWLLLVVSRLLVKVDY